MISHIITAIKTKFKEHIPNVDFDYGMKLVSDNGPLDRIIWFVEKDNYTAGNNVGSNPKQVMARECDVAFHIYASNLELLDKYLEILLYSIKFILKEDGIKETSGESLDMGQDLQAGIGYKLNVVMDLVVREPIRQTAVFTGRTITTVVN